MSPEERARAAPVFVCNLRDCGHECYNAAHAKSHGQCTGVVLAERCHRIPGSACMDDQGRSFTPACTARDYHGCDPKPKYPLDMAHPACRMGHQWRHVESVTTTTGTTTTVREDQDIIVCTRPLCGLVSIKPKDHATPTTEGSA